MDGGGGGGEFQSLAVRKEGRGNLNWLFGKSIHRGTCSLLGMQGVDGEGGDNESFG